MIVSTHKPAELRGTNRPICVLAVALGDDIALGGQGAFGDNTALGYCRSWLYQTMKLRGFEMAIQSVVVEGSESKSRCITLYPQYYII